MACSYSHYFSENYSPVIQNITYCILILLVLIYGHDMKTVDVETAFLYGDLEEEIYMECPPGDNGDEMFILDMCTYGLVQAACQCLLKSSGNSQKASVYSQLGRSMSFYP